SAWNICISSRSLLLSPRLNTTTSQAIRDEQARPKSFPAIYIDSPHDGSCVFELVRLTSDSIDPERHYHTFRIQSIDESISEEQLKSWLAQLLPSIKNNVLALSLAHNGQKTATVIFRHVPPEFASVTSGKKNSGDTLANIGASKADVTVDT
ncbi:hypothetical protein FPQ18DRAFT_294719, partial [Pyronema domesticum]